MTVDAVGNLGNYANFLRHVRRDNKAAEKLYLRAIDLDPDHANNLSQYATLLAEFGRFEEAGNFHRRAIQADETNANIAGRF